MNRKMLGVVLSVAMLIISDQTVLADGPRHRDEGVAGAVYAMTNDPGGNRVVIFHRDGEGNLTNAGSVSTGGTGSGGGFDPLGSQNSLVLSAEGRWLLAVNGGSNELSVFRARRSGLKWVDKVGSGGDLPVSVTVDRDLVYVLNAGESPNITGFTLDHYGRLTPVSDSTRFLGSGAFAQVGFDPDGESLVVTDKAGSQILIYSVDRDGRPSMSPVANASNGETPFGFIFDRRGHLLVVEVGPNAVSSYRIRHDNTLQVISGSVPNGQVAACWIVGDGRGHVFTSNPGNGTDSAYRLLRGTGQVVLLDGVAGTGTSPLDLAVSRDGRFFYALDPGNGSIDIFRINRDGSLTNLGTVDGGFAVFAQGIAAR